MNVDFAGRSVNSQSQEWCTPKKYADLIDKFFNGSLELDPCSNENSIIKSKIKFCLPYKDGLHEEWKYKSIFVNPPYGADRIRKTTIKDWFRKAWESRNKYKSEIIMLVPCATNTSHWKDYVWNKANAICFLYDTRLKFRINGNENNKGCPMACSLIYYGECVSKFEDIFRGFGAVVDVNK